MKGGSCAQRKTVRLGLGSVTIIGLGFDATDIPRIAATIKRYGDRFTHRIFTEGRWRSLCAGATPPSTSPDASPPKRP